MAPSRFVSALIPVLTLLPAPSWAQLQTTISPALPNLNLGEPAKPDDKTSADGTYCRPPQNRTDSRLPGPRVCMTNREWNALHAAGMDIAADGVSKVPIQKNTDIISH